MRGVAGEERQPVAITQKRAVIAVPSTVTLALLRYRLLPTLRTRPSMVPVWPVCAEAETVRLNSRTVAIKRLKDKPDLNEDEMRCP